jgi:hypothetical protein
LSGACLDDTSVVDQITALSDAGIQTFVVGIPGTEAYATYLDQFAIAGGRPNPAGPTQYYAVDTAGGVEGLTDVFSSITTQLINSCDVQLSRVPPDLEKVNVAIDCEVINKARYEDSGAEPVTGDWDLDEGTSPPTVRLLGGLCNFITQQGVQRVDVIFGCPPIF